MKKILTQTGHQIVHGPANVDQKEQDSDTELANGEKTVEEMIEGGALSVSDEH